MESGGGGGSHDNNFNGFWFPQQPHHEDEDFELRSFAREIPNYNVIEDEVNEAMMDHDLFSEFSFLNQANQRKPSTNQSNGDGCTSLNTSQLNTSTISDTSAEAEPPKPTLAETVGARSIKQLLQSPPVLYSGSDGESLMKTTTSFVCKKNEELDSGKSKEPTTSSNFPAVQDIKPPMTATINIPCTTVISNNNNIQQKQQQQQPIHIIQQAPVSHSTPQSTTLQALLMTPKSVQAQPQQFIITTNNTALQQQPNRMVQTIPQPIQVTATNVQLSNGISVIQQQPQIQQQQQSKPNNNNNTTTTTVNLATNPLLYGQLLQQSTTSATSANVLDTITLSPGPSEMSASPNRSPGFSSSPPNTNGLLLVQPIQQLPVEKVTPPISPNTNNTPKPPVKASKQRLSHNAIEKRYRKTITDKIEILREMLCPNNSDAKTSKAGVLEKAIQSILYYRKHVRKMQKEMEWLRKVAEKVDNIPGKIIAEQPKLEDFITEHEMQDEDFIEDPTKCIPSPPNSDVTSAPESPNSVNDNNLDYMLIQSPTNNAGNGHQLQQQQQQQQVHHVTNINTRPGMKENSRFVMCIMLFACMLFNPVNNVMYNGNSAGPSTTGSSAEDGGHIGRMILGMSSLSSSSGSGYIAGWMVNLIMLILTLMQLLVWGEPVTEENSKAHHKYNRLRIQGNQLVRKGKYLEAQETYNSCLETLGRQLPVSRFDKISCLVWNVIRFILGLIKISPWISRIKNKSNVQLSARLAAQIYHRLDQLHMTGKIPNSNSRMDGMIYCLNSINLCEVAGWKLTPPDVAVRIYATTALRMKREFPFGRWISRYFIWQSNKVLTQHSNECEEELKWLQQIDGQHFIIHNDDYDYDDNISEQSSNADNVEFSTIADREDPLSHAAFHFRKHLLNKALYSLIMPAVFTESERRPTTTDNNDNKKKRRQPPAVVALQYLQLVLQCEEDELDDGEDEAESKFWLSVAMVAAYYAMGDIQSASQYYQIVEQIPLSLKTSKNELPRMVSWALIAYRDMLNMIDNKDDSTTTLYNHNDILDKCNRASKLLRSNLLNRNNKKQIPMAFRLIACEWILKARTLLWEYTQCSDDITRRAPIEQLSAFECDVILLRTIAYDQPTLAPKICIYEATLRMMAGASPIGTTQMLNSLLHRRKRPLTSHISKRDTSKMDVEIGEYEHAYANIIACKHLPHPLLSAPRQRSCMLQQASHSMHLLNDKRHLNIANKMLKKVQ